MDLEKDTLEHLVELLTVKASIKQRVYRTTRKVFNLMKEEGKRIITELEVKIEGVDTSVQVEYKESGDFEFSLKFGGDILIVYMQSNVITFNEDFPLMQKSYIQEDPTRRYFGHITIYNFLADSIKYNRLEDPGYLIARILINKEDHFFVEGSGQLNFLFMRTGKAISAIASRCSKSQAPVDSTGSS